MEKRNKPADKRRTDDEEGCLEIRCVESWEKLFCFVVGSMRWNRFLKAKKYVDQFDEILKWNDSAGEKALHDAKTRFWLKLNGLAPCNKIPIPSSDLYIDDHIDWNPKIDPHLLKGLEVAVDHHQVHELLRLQSADQQAANDDQQDHQNSNISGS